MTSLVKDWTLKCTRSSLDYKRLRDENLTPLEKAKTCKLSRSLNGHTEGQH